MRAVCSRNVDAVLKGLQVENMRRGYRTLISNSLTSKRGLKKVEGFQAIGKGFIRRVTGRRPLYTCGYFLFASARDKTIPLLILQYVIRGVVFLCGRPSPPPRDARRAHPTGRSFFFPVTGIERSAPTSPLRLQFPFLLRIPPTGRPAWRAV